MAKTFYIPSSTGYFPVAYGNIQINIAPASGSGTLSMECKILKLGKLKLNDMSNAGSDEVRLGRMQFTFSNDNDVWETNWDDIFPSKWSTRIRVTIVGVVNIWEGFIDENQTKKYDHYIDDSGDLKYRKIDITAIDSLIYFWKNSVTLADVGYANGTTIGTELEALFNGIGSEMGITTPVWDDALIFTDSTLTKNIKDMNIRALGSDQQVSDFLKEFMQKMGCIIITWNGELRIVFYGTGDTEQAIDEDDILKGLEIENAESIVDYFKWECDFDTDDKGVYMPSGGLGDDLDGFAKVWNIAESDGTLNADDSSRNVEIDATGIVDQIGNSDTDAEYPATPSTADDIGGANHELEETTADFTANIEVGAILGMEYVSGTYGDPAHYNWRSMVIGNEDDDGTIQYFSLAQTVELNKIFVCRDTFNRTPSATGFRFKWYPISKLISSQMKLFFPNYSNPWKVPLKGISDYSDFTKKFTLLSKNFSVRSAEIDFVKDEITLKLVQLI